MRFKHGHQPSPMRTHALVRGCALLFSAQKPPGGRAPPALMKEALEVREEEMRRGGNGNAPRDVRVKLQINCGSAK